MENTDKLTIRQAEVCKLLVDENNKVYISQGIKDHFSSDSDFTVIKK